MKVRRSVMPLFLVAATLILALLLPVGLANAQEPTPTATSNLTTSPASEDNALNIQLYWMISLSGMFGGLLFGIRDKRLVLPHRYEGSRTDINPGLLTDLLFGLAGGFIIFLVVPGTFEFKPGWEAIKVLAIAVVGGYGGRAIVQKVLEQNIHQLEADVQKIQKQNKTDADALALVTQHLDADPDTPPVSEKKLREVIAASSARTRVMIFDQARQYRKSSRVNVQREDIPRVIPIFEGLIEADKDGKYHRNHSQLAYALKDQNQPDWVRAKEELDQAIRIRDANNVGGYLVYEFNRALCNINLGAPMDSILSDLERALAGPRTTDWVKHPDPVWGRDLAQWMNVNQGQLVSWLERNSIHL